MNGALRIFTNRSSVSFALRVRAIDNLCSEPKHRLTKVNMASHIKQVDVEDAYKRISPHIVRTPVKTCDLIDQMTGRKVYFKCENLQKTGSFKVRGALNAVSVYMFSIIYIPHP